jgi:RpiR family carbohydrate utilization transcriptional regulator
MGEENTLLHIRGVFPTLRPAEQRVAQEILKNPAEAVHLSITELGRRAEVSDATVVKFCKRLGYKGFQEFKILLAQDVATKPEPIYGEIKPGDDPAAVRDKIFQSNIQALQDTAQTLSAESLSEAVKAMVAASEIHFYGLGASGLVAQDAEQKFARIGLPARSFVDTHMQLTRAALLGPGDVAVGISYSGETIEVAHAIELAKRAGAVAIGVTNFPKSRLAQLCDIVLLTAAQENVFRSGAISSRIAQLSTVDALFISVALEDYERSQDCIERTRAAVASRKQA